MFVFLLFVKKFIFYNFIFFSKKKIETFSFF